MKPKILAHRTGLPGAMGNSLEGFRKCFWDRADSVECDITFVKSDKNEKDREAVIWADGMNEYLEGYNTPSSLQLYWADIRNWCLKKYNTPLSRLRVSDVSRLKREGFPAEKIPTIEDVWDFIDTSTSPCQNIKIFFDVKYYFKDMFGHFFKISQYLIDLTIEKIVRPAISKGVCDRIGFVTFYGGLELLRAVKNEDPQIHTNLITILPWTKLDNHLDCLDSLTIGWNRANGWLWSISDKKLEKIIKEAKSKGVKIYGGHANTKKNMLWLLRKNFDGIWTDDIQLAINTIRTFNKQERRGNE